VTAFANRLLHNAWLRLGRLPQFLFIFSSCLLDLPFPNWFKAVYFPQSLDDALQGVDGQVTLKTELFNIGTWIFARIRNFTLRILCDLQPVNFFSNCF